MLVARGLDLVAGRVLCAVLDLTVRPGEVWGVLGPNGSGKTTLLHALAGVRPPAAGAVCWSEAPLAGLAPRVRARHVGLLPQHEDGDFWGTVHDYVLLGRYPHAASALAWDAADDAAARAALADMGLEAFGARDYRSLSGGERQRARIAQLLAQAPACLLLDEPLAHLDLRQQGRVLALLRREAAAGRAVGVVLHEALWAARACTHVLLLDGCGHARQGAVAEVLTREAVAALYDCPVHEFAAGGVRYLVPEL